jgi:hypothetical protein
MNKKDKNSAINVTKLGITGEKYGEVQISSFWISINH